MLDIYHITADCVSPGYVVKAGSNFKAVDGVRGEYPNLIITFEDGTIMPAKYWTEITCLDVGDCG